MELSSCVQQNAIAGQPHKNRITAGKGTRAKRRQGSGTVYLKDEYSIRKRIRFWKYQKEKKQLSEN